MRRAARIDVNQPEIVKGLRALGATVTILSAVGNGCPDILVGYRGVNILFEIKNLDGRGKRLTPAETVWHNKWQGTAYIITDIYEAVEILNQERHQRLRL